MNIEISTGKLVYVKEDYTPAIDWQKTFMDGKYAYAKAETSVEPLYFGARYMEKTADEGIFVQNGFMADMTVLNPGKVGDEFVKTVGHYHGTLPGLTISSPEVYEALSDGIEYLLQSEPDQDGKVAVIWVVTKAGDKVVMPPCYGHVSMNVGDKPAVEVDIQKRDNPNFSDYSMFKERIGGAFYRTDDGLTKNPNYEVSSLRIVKPLEVPEWGITKGKTLYDSFVEAPEKFDWLVHPDKYDFDLDVLFTDIEL